MVATPFASSRQKSKVVQDGDDGANITFDVAHFEVAAEIMKPNRRRPGPSPEHLQKMCEARDRTCMERYGQISPQQVEALPAEERKLARHYRSLADRSCSCDRQPRSRVSSPNPTQNTTEASNGDSGAAPAAWTPGIPPMCTLVYKFDTEVFRRLDLSKAEYARALKQEGR